MTCYTGLITDLGGNILPRRYHIWTHHPLWRFRVHGLRTQRWLLHQSNTFRVPVGNSVVYISRKVNGTPSSYRNSSFNFSVLHNLTFILILHPIGIALPSLHHSESHVRFSRRPVRTRSVIWSLWSCILPSRNDIHDTLCHTGNYRNACCLDSRYGSPISENFNVMY